MAELRKSTLGLLLLDILAILGCFNAALFYRNISDGLVFLPLLAPLAVSMIAIYLIDGYKAHTDMMSLEYTSQHSIALLASLLGTLLLTFVVVPAGYELQGSRAAILLSYICLIPLSLSYRRITYSKAVKARGVRSVVFVGDMASCLAFEEECAKTSIEQPVIFSIPDTKQEPSRPPFTAPTDLPTRPFHEVLTDIESGNIGVDAIVLRESNRDLKDDISHRLIQLYFSGVPTYTLELFHQVHWRKIPVYRLNHTWLFQEGFPIAREPVFERVKRASDVFLALVGLIISAPLIFISGIAIWFEDRGPVFFTQQRIGRNRIPFRIYKLRTMRTNQESSNHYTQPNDSRITKVGAFLRLSRLDELPQLWNVLKGEMSLIGPRAEWDELVERYGSEIHCYHFRHLVKPGITGWAQVNYPYGENMEDTIRKLEYDLYYIRHFSFLLDAAIVLKTIHIMLFGKGR